MSDFRIRALVPDEHRAALSMFRTTLLGPDFDDRHWERAQHSFQPGRNLGALDGDAVIGLARSVDAELTVPGGKQVALGAVTSVGVRSDRTRRGVMTGLVQAQLAEFAERGVPLAALHASETTIYGRFGYGVATQERSFSVNRNRARLRDPRPGSGRIELHDLDDAARIMPELYAPFAAARTGMITRPSYLWAPWEGHYRRTRDLMRLAVHHGPDGVDGYAAYRVRNPWPDPGDAVLTVEDMNAGSAEAFRGLWRYLLGVDLVDRIDARTRPLDEPAELLLTDPRTCSTREITDEVWLRLVDVPAALAAREYGDGAGAVIEVNDPVLTGNSGRYRVSSAGVQPTGDAAALRMDVDVLAMLYLGGWRLAELVRAGRVEVVDPAAVADADRLFATDRVPWCGTFF